MDAAELLMPEGNRASAGDHEQPGHEQGPAESQAPAFGSTVLLFLKHFEHAVGDEKTADHIGRRTGHGYEPEQGAQVHNRSEYLEMGRMGILRRIRIIRPSDHEG